MKLAGRAVSFHPVQSALIALVRAYRFFFSPWIGSACRFEPTCSRYAADALRLRGPLVGPALAIWRVLRCNPWSKGGYDPVKPR